MIAHKSTVELRASCFLAGLSCPFGRSAGEGCPRSAGTMDSFPSFLLQQASLAGVHVEDKTAGGEKVHRDSQGWDLATIAPTAFLCPCRSYCEPQFKGKENSTVFMGRAMKSHFQCCRFREKGEIWANVAIKWSTCLSAQEDWFRQSKQSGDSLSCE